MHRNSSFSCTGVESIILPSVPWKQRTCFNIDSQKVPGFLHFFLQIWTTSPFFKFAKHGEVCPSFSYSLGNISLAFLDGYQRTLHCFLVHCSLPGFLAVVLQELLHALLFCTYRDAFISLECSNSGYTLSFPWSSVTISSSQQVDHSEVL